MRVRARFLYGSARDVYSVYERDEETGLLVPIAGLHTELARRARVEISSQGFRGPEVPVPKPPSRLRLAFLGGSTTFCARASSNERTWPHLATERLAASFPGVELDYLNAGVTGSSVDDSRRAIPLRLAGMEPDVVVIYHAAKDLADDTRALAVAGGLFEEPGEPGWLERRSLLWQLMKMNLGYLSAQRAGRGDGPKLDADPASYSGGFRARLTELVRAARSEASLVVLVTFAIRTRAEQPPEVQLENLAHAFTFTPYLAPDAILAGYAEYNRVIVEVARETGAALIEGHATIPGTAEYFSDSVHFTEAGYAAMAERVAEALAAADPFRELVAARAREATR
ncbi:MAG: SGNH/GDSL hydrolase family protein [Planctomycetota bacterium]